MQTQSIMSLNTPRLHKHYTLGQTFNEVYFTHREAQCMTLLLQGIIFVADIAAILCLSPRTVEFYLSNMRDKLGCHTKLELIDLIKKSDFPQYLEF